MKNSELAGIFRSIAQILQIKGENVFRIRAYERAAQNIEGVSQDIEELARKQELFLIPGIGKDLAEKINEFLRTGHIALHEELKKSVPDGVLALLDIPSVGPKTAKLLHETLKIHSIDDLRGAIEAGRLKSVPGIKEKTIANIVKGIGIVQRGRERMTLAQAEELADEFIGALSKLPQTNKITAAGSLRRGKETVRDIDILVTSAQPAAIMDTFTRLPGIRHVTAHGETKSSVLTRADVQVDCRVVDEASYGAALLYFTGSKDFNIKLRRLALKRKLKLNEYGVFRGNKALDAGSEQDIFKALGMAYVEPELREDTGEIEAALRNKLPRLITIKDVRGDLHAHSTWSDGGSTIEEMAEAARGRGYEYIAITDHSQSLKIAGGLSPADLKKKRAEIDALNKRMKGVRILFGTEADIAADGSLDYPDGLLRDFDVVVAAIHGGFKQSRRQLTRRIVSACKNKHVHIIAHPTGRLWGSREPYDIDFDEILKAARDTNTSLEINAFPNRLDLNDVHARRAKASGVTLAVDTDSHEALHLKAMRYGIAVARRAWLEPGDVINTLPLKQLLGKLKK